MVSLANSTLGQAVSSEALALLARLGAQIAQCSGEYSTARRLLLEGRVLYQAAADAPDELVRERLQLLQWSRAAERDNTAIGVDALNQQLQKVESRNVAVKRWNSHLQTPHVFIKSLYSHPWHSTTMWPMLLPVVHLLRAAHAELRSELLAIAGAGPLVQDRDCIHHSAIDRADLRLYSPLTGLGPI